MIIQLVYIIVTLALISGCTITVISAVSLAKIYYYIPKF